MGLVDYSSSEDDEPENPAVVLHPATVALPELPTGFHDLYSGIFPWIALIPSQTALRR